MKIRLIYHIQGADNATATVPVRTHPLLRGS